VEFARRLAGEVDIVHTFNTNRATLRETLRAVKRILKPGAAIWVSWPKKASRVETDITEDTIREIALPMGLVDIKVCAVNDVWSGLKFVIPVKDRAKMRRSVAMCSGSIAISFSVPSPRFWQYVPGAPA
jgi:hypothetical protein